MEKKELTTFQRAIAIITVTSLTVYSVVNLALVANAYSKLESNITELGDLIDNWQQYTVTDIQVATTCPSGYETLSSRLWPGTDAGCWCGSVSQSTLNTYNITCGPFCTSSCSATELTAGCTSVTAQSAVQLKYLGYQSTTSYQICLKRGADTWAKAASLSKSGSCPLGYITCGSGSDYVFCISSGYCPITSITIATGVSSGALTSCTNLVPAISGCIVLTNDGSDRRTLTYSRVDANTLPLSMFKVDEYAACKLADDEDVTSGRLQFPLISEKLSTCTNGNYKWNTMTQITEDLLFKYNGMTSTITYLNNFYSSGMSGYYPTSQTGANFNWYAFSQNYFPWKTSCRDRMQSLINKKTFVDNMKTSQLALLVIAIISTIFMGIPLCVMEVQNLRGVDLSCISGKGEEERTKLKKFKKITTYIFKGFQLPFQIWAIVTTGSAKALLTSVANDNCSNSYTNTTLAYIATTTNATFKSTLVALGLLVITLLLDLILEAWEKRKAKKEAKNATVSPTSREEKLELANIDHEGSTSPLQFNSPAKPTPVGPQSQMQPQVQPQVQPNITIQINQPPQQAPLQFQPQQQAPMQFQPQQYPPQQQQFNQPLQFGQPQQYPPQQQGYPQQQFGQPQQYPQQGYPQQQYPPRY